VGEREKILERVREALTVPAPHPGSHTHGPAQMPPAVLAGVAASPQAKPPTIRDWLPPVGDCFADRVACFARQSTELRTEFYHCADSAEAFSKLLEISKREGFKRIGSHRAELTDAACAVLKLPVLLTDAPYSKIELEKCDAGISECDALVAQTGSVVVTSRSAGGRALSVLPPHHIVLARRAQLLRDLPEAFALLRERYATNFPSFMSVITGPSRTGDIERILVLGAHGPKKLTVLLVD
jgi:L-lactate dehydrogenase complex protein LldG